MPKTPFLAGSHANGTARPWRSAKEKGRPNGQPLFGRTRPVFATEHIRILFLDQQPAIGRLPLRPEKIRRHGDAHADHELAQERRRDVAGDGGAGVAAGYGGDQHD